MRPVWARQSVRAVELAAGDLERRLLQSLPRQVDPHTQINPRHDLQAYQRRECHVGVGLGIHGKDHLALATKQFVDAQILDMAAVGEVDVQLIFIEPPAVSAAK